MNRPIRHMNRHTSLSQRLSRSDISRLTALCLIFVAIDQLNDPLLNATLWQEAGYWLARVGALALGLSIAALLIKQLPSARWSNPPWFRPILLVTALGILPLVIIEVIMEPRLPVRPEFVDDELRAVSPLLAFLAEYITLATILFPFHLVLWFVLPQLTHEAKAMETDVSPSKKSVPEFLAQVGVCSVEFVLALKAEEHYVKVFTNSGDHLVLQRFNVAVKSMPAELGLQVHRSWWVANNAVITAKRGDRRWQLQLENELTVPISDSYVRSVRARGLLDRKSAKG